MDLPSFALQSHLSQPVPVTRRSSGMIALPVEFDTQQEGSLSSRMPNSKIDEISAHADLRYDIESVLLKNCSVRGATRYLESGLREPQCVIEKPRSVMASCDPVGRWLDECTVSDPSARTGSSELYRNSCVCTSREGGTAIPLKTFAQNFIERGFQKKKIRGVMVWPGIRIHDHEDNNAAHRSKAGPFLEHRSQITFRRAIMHRPLRRHLPGGTSHDVYTAARPRNPRQWLEPPALAGNDR